MKKVSISPGCITCGLCEFIEPNVFEVTDVSHVKKDVVVENYEKTIQQAVASCPVNVIVYEQE